MEYQLDRQGEARLEEYFDQIGAVLNNKKRRESFATYAMGLLGEGERKSAEPIAARACADPEKIHAAHQRLTYFTREAEWSDADVRRVAAQHALSAMTARAPVYSWVIDDTGFLKQGDHSVGVQRQYTGSAGKVANCQVGVSLSITTVTDHVVVDFELYLPKSWTDSPARRLEAKIPAHVEFKTKLELALAMINRAVAAGYPPGVVLADSAYGNDSKFRRALRIQGLDYAVGLHSNTTVWRLDRLGRRLGDPVAVEDLAVGLGRKNFRKTTWRAGTKGKLSSRFAVQRVVLAQDDGLDPAQRESVWLVMEWPDGEEGPTDYTVCTLPETTTRKQLVRQIKDRWRTERVYEDAKGELGLDHFEGRTYRGWHHHVSVVLACFAFIVAERVSAIPPSAQEGHTPEASRCRPLCQPARATLPKLVHHHPPRGRPGSHQVVAEMPVLSPN